VGTMRGLCELVSVMGWRSGTREGCGDDQSVGGPPCEARCSLSEAPRHIQRGGPCRHTCRSGSRAAGCLQFFHQFRLGMRRWSSPMTQRAV
jgi:hypothetical protein